MQCLHLAEWSISRPQHTNNKNVCRMEQSFYSKTTIAPTYQQMTNETNTANNAVFQCFTMAGDIWHVFLTSRNMSSCPLSLKKAQPLVSQSDQVMQDMTHYYGKPQIRSIEILGISQMFHVNMGKYWTTMVILLSLIEVKSGTKDQYMTKYDKDQ